MKNIVLGVTGSIAAYKAADIANALTKDGYNVDVIMTKGGMEFITPLTLQTLSKNKVYTDVFDNNHPMDVEHISLAKKADLLLIAPASADIIGKMANGIADDMLTTTILAMKNIPKFIAPAMNTAMYENPIVQENMKRLISFGYNVIQPKVAYLAEGQVGKGALENVETIVQIIEERLRS